MKTYSSANTSDYKSYKQQTYNKGHVKIAKQVIKKGKGEIDATSTYIS